VIEGNGMVKHGTPFRHIGYIPIRNVVIEGMLDRANRFSQICHFGKPSKFLKWSDFEGPSTM
jgi:hypothetical protein